MKRFIIITSVIVVVIISAVIGLIASVPIWMPADKLKGMIVEKLSAETGREISIGAMKYDIFRGIMITGLSIMEPARYNKRVFIKDDSVELKYNLFALLTGRLVINRVELDSPYCEIIKEKDGKFNFSDMLKNGGVKKSGEGLERGSKIKPEPVTAASTAKTAPLFLKNIVVTGIYVKNGKFAYADYTKTKPSGMTIENFNLSIEDIILSAIKPVKMDMDFLLVSGEYRIPVSMRATVKSDLPLMTAEIEIESLSAAGTDSKGKINIAGAGDVKGDITTAVDFKKVMDVLPGSTAATFKKTKINMTAVNENNFTFTANELKFTDTLDIIRGAAVSGSGEIPENIRATMEFANGKLAGGTKMKLYGGTVGVDFNADINNKKYGIKAAVKKVNLHGFTGDIIAFMPRKNPDDKNILDEIKDKVYGTLDMNASFSGTTFNDIPHTIKGTGYFAVTNGKMESLDIAKNLGTALQVDSLKNDIVFDILSADFKMSSGKISTDDLKMSSGPDGKSGDIRLAGAGYTTVDNGVDFKLQMDFNPRVAKSIGTSMLRLFKINDSGYACDSDGWLPLDARIYNTVKNQKYALSQPRMIANIKRNLGKKLEKEGVKTIENRAKQLLNNFFN